MILVYISGPYRHKDMDGVLQNCLAARYVARQMWKIDGVAAICPHMNTIFMDGDDIPAEKFIDGDKEMVRRCDAVFFVGDYVSSEGAMLELGAAVESKKPCFTSMVEFKKWLASPSTYSAKASCPSRATSS